MSFLHKNRIWYSVLFFAVLDAILQISIARGVLRGGRARRRPRLGKQA